MFLSKSIYKIIACTLFGVSVMLVIKSFSHDSSETKNGFKRTTNLSVNLINKIQLKGSEFYFAGASEGYFYVGDNQNPFEFVRINNTFSDSSRYNLKYIDSLNTFQGIGRLAIDSPYIHYSEGVTPLFFSGNLNELKMYDDLDSNSYYISAYLISKNTWILDSYAPSEKQRILRKKTADNEIIKYKLEKQIDGIFCTQGVLSFDKKTKTLFYTYSYRNQFVCLDTNLNTIYKANTIDTNSIAKVKVTQITDSRSKLSAPPVTINTYSCTDKGILYIQSARLGDNEDSREYENMAQIDTYSTANGTYLGSFHLPNILNHSKLGTFIIANRSLIATYGNQLALYSITSNLK